ncbi:hypothetical protein J6590_035377 [Homalodisca vitripennis]|nr:hypothetical protein J6590_035377 [Homalodisca vitripennis]
MARGNYRMDSLYGGGQAQSGAAPPAANHVNDSTVALSVYRVHYTELALGQEDELRSSVESKSYEYRRVFFRESLDELANDEERREDGG